MTIAVAADHHLETENAYRRTVQSGDDLSKAMYRIQAEPGKPIRLTKTVSYHTARVVPPSELLDRCERTLARVLEYGVARQYEDQRAWLADHWRRCDVEVGGQPEIQQAVRWNLFSVIQAAARADGSGIPAKGVSGSGLRRPLLLGHRDLRAPVPDLHQPVGRAERAAVPATRCSTSARRRARDLAQRGALFPWRTINGEEASAYYAAGTAQYHIDADIAYALSQYVGATGDEDFLSREAIDIFVETARLWADLGFWRNEDGRDVPHPRRHRAGRVHHRRQRQPLHERARALQPAPRGGGRGRARARPTPTAYTAMVRRVRLDEAEPVEWAALRQGHEHPVRRAPRRAPAGRALPRARDVGPREHPDGRSGRCCCTTTRW